MRSSFVRLLSRILIVCMIGLPFQAQAGLIGTDQVVTAEQALAARAMVNSMVSRADVASQLQALGLSPETAKGRVAALTDSEVTQLAGQLQNLPAGANSGGALIVLILIGILIWWLVTKK